jgi:glycerol-3-phosphate dehydrogenase (NAD(P)+)
VIAVTSTDVGPRLTELGAVVDGGHLIVHAVGALAAPDDVRVSELIERATPVCGPGVLAGPALPGDLASGRFASMVVASAFDEVVAEARRLLNLPPALRLYGSRDVAASSWRRRWPARTPSRSGWPTAPRSASGRARCFITRAVAEAARLLEATGGRPAPSPAWPGSATCWCAPPATTIPTTRFGQALARGDAIGPRTTEGARAAVTALRLAERKRVRMPLLAGLAGVVAGKVSVADAARLAADTVAAEE